MRGHSSRGMWYGMIQVHRNTQKGNREENCTRPAANGRKDNLGRTYHGGYQRQCFWYTELQGVTCQNVRLQDLVQSHRATICHNVLGLPDWAKSHATVLDFLMRQSNNEGTNWSKSVYNKFILLHNTSHLYRNEYRIPQYQSLKQFIKCPKHIHFFNLNTTLQSRYIYRSTFPFKNWI